METVVYDFMLTKMKVFQGCSFRTADRGYSMCVTTRYGTGTVRLLRLPIEVNGNSATYIGVVFCLHLITDPYINVPLCS
jgi:hypothetical protein